MASKFGEAGNQAIRKPERDRCETETDCGLRAAAGGTSKHTARWPRRHRWVSAVGALYAGALAP